MRARIFASITCTFALALMLGHGSVRADLSNPAQVDRAVMVADVKSQGEAVSGVVVNRSPRTIRDVRLIVRQEWQWQREMKPGDDSPGRSDAVTIGGDIPPGTSRPFTHRFPAALPQRTDGSFHTTVEVVGFSEVGL